MSRIKGSQTSGICRLGLHSLLLGCFAFVVSACGGSIEDMAQNNLYGLKMANKTDVPEQPPQGYEQKIHQLAGGDTVHSWAFDDKDDRTRLVVVYFHGNAVNIGGLYESNFLKVMEGLPGDFVVMDYPGYGKASGKPSQESIMLGVEKVLSYTRQRFPGHEVVVWGRSLGAAVAIQSLKTYPGVLKRFVVTSPWTSVYETVKHHFSSLASSLPEEWLSKNQWNSIETAQGLTQKGLLQHGNKDSIIPFKFGERLYKAFPGARVRFSRIEGKDHNDIFAAPELWREISDFL